MPRTGEVQDGGCRGRCNRMPCHAVPAPATGIALVPRPEMAAFVGQK